ncbi:hypothetical protein Tco_0322381 [Tanacetum coccineum]
MDLMSLYQLAINSGVVSPFQKGACPWLTENHFNSQYVKHCGPIQSIGTRKAINGFEKSLTEEGKEVYKRRGERGGRREEARIESRREKRGRVERKERRDGRESSNKSRVDG